MERMTFTLSDQLAADLRYLSERMGISRSALLGKVSEDPIHDLAGLVRQVPAEGVDSDTVRRLRGASRELIEKRMQAAFEQLEG